MSYLSAPRLHFAGTFQASVSTVNNDPTHFKVKGFDPKNQLPMTPDDLRGWWNPQGNGVFRLLGCEVTSAFWADGTPVEKTDPIIGAALSDSNRRAPAKLVDLDPQQQLLSTIFGLEVRLGKPDSRDWLRAQFKPASFFDIWTRTPTGSQDEAGGAAYQSVLTDIEWLEPSGSDWLKDFGARMEGKWRKRSGSTALDEFLARNATGELSIKFNVDGFCVQPTSPNFCRGRIVGTIGLALKGEPRHHVRGRHFIADTIPARGFPVPAGQIFNCVAAVDRPAGKLRIDLGNSLPVLRSGGPLRKGIGTLSLAYPIIKSDGKPGTGQVKIDFSAKPYREGAGIFDLSFTSGELDEIEKRPLALMLTASDDTSQVALRETPGGLYVQPDESTFRLSTHGRCRVPVYATKFGLPYVGAHVVALHDNSWLQRGSGDPPVGEPADALQFTTKRKTNEHGRISWPFRAGDPQRKREYIDGQVYAARFALVESLHLAVRYPFTQISTTSFLVWDVFPGDRKLTWHGSMSDIFTLYANLYPVMNRIVDMSDYHAVVQRASIIARAMSLPFNDANYMPVSRDLSPAKVRAVLKWLKDPVEGKPSSGAPAPDRLPPTEDMHIPGGKTAAFERTLLAQSLE